MSVKLFSVGDLRMSAFCHLFYEPPWWRCLRATGEEPTQWISVCWSNLTNPWFHTIQSFWDLAWSWQIIPLHSTGQRTHKPNPDSKDGEIDSVGSGPKFHFKEHEKREAWANGAMPAINPPQWDHTKCWGSGKNVNIFREKKSGYISQRMRYPGFIWMTVVTEKVRSQGTGWHFKADRLT